jgi:hypothetical protein
MMTKFLQNTFIFVVLVYKIEMNKMKTTNSFGIFASYISRKAMYSATNLDNVVRHLTRKSASDYMKQRELPHAKAVRLPVS